jgi:hypothetical protein
MLAAPRRIAVCCLTVLLALSVVGAVSHGSLRHMVQTLPLWCPIIMGARRQDLSKWSALPCLVFWLFIATLIWLYLLGWARTVSGRFSAVEIAMTLVVGVACVGGLLVVTRWRTAVRLPVALGAVLLIAALQVLAFRISLLPLIANR